MSALEQMAARAADDPLFLACALAVFARSEELDDAGLAAAIGCPPDQLTRLKLCGMPREKQFGADVAAIAARYGLDADVLEAVVVRWQSVARLRGAAAPSGAAQYFLAARDGDHEPPPAPPEDTS